jgi:ribulose-5-phosphate 4-epimerase/fuculose-1-phosphate aldolase
MILRNHGLLTVGPAPADAFLAMYIMEAACAIQVRAGGAGVELVKIPAALVAGIQAQAKAVTRGLGANLVWPGLLRKLDRVDPSYRD